MIRDRRVLALIPARGGSKGLPGKNLLPVAGRPMIAWTIDAARRSRFVDSVVLSSDDDAIIQAARDLGCEVPFRRPAELASDTAASIDVVLHALDHLPVHDLVVLLQPTSPLRDAADIDAAIERCVDGGATSCVSVSPATESPYWMYRLDADQRLLPVLERPVATERRQDLPVVYVLNGAVYVAEVSWLRDSKRFVDATTFAHVMPAERSIDIDTSDDYERLCRIVDSRTPSPPPAGNSSFT